MQSRPVERLSGTRRFVITVAASTAIAAPVAVGVLTSPLAQGQVRTSDTEEPHVSIQLWSKDHANTPPVSPGPGRWYLQWHLPLRALIAQAYGVSESQVVGRDWSKDPAYLIEADGPSQPSPTIFKDILLKHFGLVVRTEPQQMQGYVLLVGNGGSKLKPYEFAQPGGEFLPNGVDMTGMPLSTLVMSLQRNLVLAAPVIDQTGLEGNYDYKVTWQQPSPGAPADPAAVAKALQAQLGLHLEARSVTADLITVVSVKPPAKVVTHDFAAQANPPSAARTLANARIDPVVAMNSPTTDAGAPAVSPTAVASQRQRGVADSDKTRDLAPNFVDAEIRQIAKAVAMATDKKFVIDPPVHAYMTMLTTKPISSETFYRRLLDVLHAHGFVAVRGGEVVKILPAANSR